MAYASQILPRSGRVQTSVPRSTIGPSAVAKPTADMGESATSKEAHAVVTVPFTVTFEITGAAGVQRETVADLLGARARVLGRALDRRRAVIRQLASWARSRRTRKGHIRARVLGSARQ